MAPASAGEAARGAGGGGPVGAGLVGAGLVGAGLAGVGLAVGGGAWTAGVGAGRVGLAAVGGPAAVSGGRDSASNPDRRSPVALRLTFGRSEPRAPTNSASTRKESTSSSGGGATGRRPLARSGTPGSRVTSRMAETPFSGFRGGGGAVKTSTAGGADAALAVGGTAWG